MTLIEMVDAFLRQQAEDDKPFTARTLAGITGEDVHAIRRILDRKVKDGAVATWMVEPPDNRSPYAVYRARACQVSKQGK